MPAGYRRRRRRVGHRDKAVGTFVNTRVGAVGRGGPWPSLSPGRGGTHLESGRVRPRGRCPSHAQPATGPSVRHPFPASSAHDTHPCPSCGTSLPCPHGLSTQSSSTALYLDSGVRPLPYHTPTGPGESPRIWVGLRSDDGSDPVTPYGECGHEGAVGAARFPSVPPTSRPGTRSRIGSGLWTDDARGRTHTPDLHLPLGGRRDRVRSCGM